ncbi:MAG TPA: hypothetical protein VFQ61_11125 [Polyangiaceae bacterium]|nr:hypothetical protein [Polyangiaceae bacterium]
MTQFRRLIEMGDEELACSLIAAMQEEMPPAGSLARAGAAVGLPAALIAAPASLLAAPGAVSGVVVSGVGAGLAAGAGLGTPASVAVAGAAAPVVAASASALPGGLLPATLSALFKPFLMGLLGGAFALGGVQLALKTAPRAVEARSMEAGSEASDARGLARSAGERNGSNAAALESPPPIGALASPRGGDSAIATDPSDGGAARAAQRPISASAQPRRTDSGRAEFGSGSKPVGARATTTSLDNGEVLAITPSVTAALPDAPPEPSAAPEVAKKPGPSALVAEIALIDQARTALLTGKPERVLAVLALYRGTSFLPEAEKLRSQAEEQLRKRKMAETQMAP